MKITSTIVFEFADQTRRLNVQKSLEPDVQGDNRERCKVNVNGSGKKMKVEMEATDETALRASTNTYLKTIALLRGEQ
ncbi:MAG: hypothetical protein GOU97_04050 [Nanoarchaeota archaeon]|nr:hypothetical protein [Nanoarchaeota archaeon]